MSVDRLCHDDTGHPFCTQQLDAIAAQECVTVGTNFYGWYALTKTQVESTPGLTVVNSPTESNPYHSDIKRCRSLLNYRSVRDELAGKARPVGRFSDCSSTSEPTQKLPTDE